MIYRPMGTTGLKMSALSMGCGRLPADDAACDALLRACVDAGINYFETAVSYCDGQCQQKTGRGLEPVGDRVMISAKHGVLLEDEQPGCKETTGDDFRREIVEHQLPNLRTDHVEWCQVGWFAANKLEAVQRKGGVMDGVHRLMDEGVVGHVGFTSHDTPENVITIIESGLFESCTLQYNLLNRSYECALDAARVHGVAVVVMGPLHAGLMTGPELALGDVVPEALQTAEAGLRFVLSNPAVSCACSGMNAIEQLAQNVATVESSGTVTDWSAMASIPERFEAVRKTLCTGCGDCSPCPQGVDIARNLRIRNYLMVYQGTEAARRAYAAVPAAQRADRCDGCGECDGRCPGELAIQDILAEIADACAC